MMKLKWQREQKQQLIEQVQHYFELERSEEIGTIAAEQLLDHMVALLGPHVYNQAIKDARTTVVERMQAMEDELYALEKNVSAPRGGSR